MTASAKAVTFRRLTKRALSIGVIKVSDTASQFLLPVVLVRCLDAATFGEYRLLWLLVGSVLGLATLNMAAGLPLYLPPAEAPRKRLYVHQSLLYLAISGLLFGALASPWNPWMPAAMAPLQTHGALVPSFVALWIVASMLDSLPTVEEHVSGALGANGWYVGNVQVTWSVADDTSAVISSEINIGRLPWR